MVGRKIILIISLMLVSMNIWAQKEINTEDFKKHVWDFQANPQYVVLKSNIPVILDFYATWCRPCKMLTPELIALQKEYEGKLIIYKIDVDKEPELSRLFGIKAMPTLYFLPLKGNVTYAQGYTTKDQLKEIVDMYFFNKK
jgi:thioredoxin